MESNKAALLTHKQAKPFKVEQVPFPEPGPHHVVMRTHAAAINPADALIQSTGLLIENFPAILGLDGAGEVVKVGSAVTKFKPGDRVVGQIEIVNGDMTTINTGSFQLYFRTREVQTSKIPDGISYAQASVLPLAVSTAAGGLFEPNTLALQLPQPGGSKHTGKVVIVWGAGSSVGSCAVQIARAAGYEVAATAGPQNQKYLRELGAEYVFDYKSDTVSEDIVAALKGKESAGIFCAIIAPETILQCTLLAQKLGGKQMVATVRAPGQPGQYVPDEAPKSVETPPDAGIKDEKVMEAVWGKWLPAALADGSMKCKPDPKVVGKGLEYCQEACDVWMKGVSASKIVVEL